MNLRSSIFLCAGRFAAVCFASGMSLGWCLPLAAAEQGGTNSAASTHSSAPTTPPARVDYSTFKVVTERNIFNAGRSGRAPMPGGETRRPARVDSFGLVGTMEYERGPVAFFDGSNSEYRKALRPNSTNCTIAGWKLTAASFQGVKLQADTNVVELKVGMSLRREEDGPWVTSTSTDFTSSSSESGFASSRDSGRDSGRSYGRDSGRDYRSRGSSSGSTTPTSAPSSAEVSDALKRLMERRAKEDQ